MNGSPKILLAYKAFGADGIDRLERALDVQQKYAETRSMDKLLVTDATSKFNFPGVTVLRTDKEYTLATCNFSKMRNMSLDFAAKGPYTHVLLLDSDSIVISFPNVHSGRCFTNTLPHPTLAMSERKYPYCWFLIPREIFDLRWNENFVGWGWEDIDYQNNVLRANECTYYGKGVYGDHMDHPMRSTKTPEWEANERLYNENKSKITTTLTHMPDFFK
jgi:hypothetical protein